MHNKDKNIDKVKNFKGTIKKLLKYLHRYRIKIVLVIIFAIGSTVFSITGPKILGTAITELFDGLLRKFSNMGGIDLSKISKILVFLLILYIISAVFTYIESYIMEGVTQKITYKLRKQVSEKINKMPFSYFDNKTHGEVLSIITNDIDVISQNLNQCTTGFITAVVTFVGVLIMMLSINVTMTVLTSLIIPLSFVTLVIIMNKSQKHFKNQQDYLARVNGKIEEMFTGHTIVKAYNAEKKVIGEFEKDNEVLYESAWKSRFLSGLIHPIMSFIDNLNYVVIAIAGGYFTIIGKIAVGSIQSFIQYSKIFTRPIIEIAETASLFQLTVAAAERVFDFLEEKEEVYTKNPIKVGKIDGNIEFKNVNFGYLENQTIINDFSAKVKKGQKVAIVGPTGAGKTTMVKLLMRFYPINGGNILIDGNDINDFARDDLRSIFGMVLQDTWLFNGTIMENLRYGKLDATDDEVIEAAKIANVHHFIQTLPDGYNMIINEETNNISQGQKQLLTIARAILADPKILILDEATSSVDTRTEILIQNAMDKLMKGRTSFVIAHRLSTIKDADTILVMDNGDIIEQGNHDHLIKQNGFYTNLYNSQFEKIESVN